MLRWLLVLLMMAPQLSLAQSGDELDAILGVDDSDEESVEERPRPKPVPVKRSSSKRKKMKSTPPPDNTVSGLSQLAPFKDVAVIQRRFLPKTERFEIFPHLGVVVNNSFFWNSVLGIRLGYHFSETLGIEAGFSLIGSSSKSVTDNLEKNLLVVVDEIVIPESYYGATFKWTPIYGKLGLTETTIVPFDLYFQAGAGLTSTNQDTTPLTFHLGTGQIFAITQSMAFRWDLGWYFYNTESKSGGISGSFTDMYLSMGVSLFFPEAVHR